MKQVRAIWIRHGFAKLFRFQEGPGIWSIQTLEDTDRKQLFLHLAESLRDAETVLLLGPDLAKYQFRNHLVEHFPMIARRVVGCEAMNQMPDPEIADWIHRYAPVA